MIWNTTINYTRVGRDSLIVLLRCTLAYSENALCALACLKGGGANREDG
jgi:hypothetical protein